MGEFGEPFIGSEALAGGAVTWHQLRTRYRALFPDVYVSRLATPSARQRTVAAWLWSRRRATIAGLAAAGLHGTKWIDDPDGMPFAFLDMGWEEWMLAVEYDGDHHRLNRSQYVHDIHRFEKVEDVGWRVVKVVAEDRPAEILRRVKRLAPTV